MLWSAKALSVIDTGQLLGYGQCKVCMCVIHFGLFVWARSVDDQHRSALILWSAQHLSMINVGQLVQNYQSLSINIGLLICYGPLKVCE